MEPIYIPRLTKAPERKEVIQVDEFISGLETLTPLRGRIQATHQGNYLEVSAVAEAIVTLTCHRCLQRYNHRLSLKTSELIWLDESADRPDSGPLERETPLEDLVESLPPTGYFQPDIWLYEQLCLAIPLRQLCNTDCPGITQSNTGDSETSPDRRWASLEALKRKLPRNG